MRKNGVENYEYLERGEERGDVEKGRGWESIRGGERGGRTREGTPNNTMSRWYESGMRSIMSGIFS